MVKVRHWRRTLASRRWRWQASMDPDLPRLERETRRRRAAPMFRHQRVPVRMLVPNFFTLLGAVRRPHLHPHVDRGPL